MALNGLFLGGVVEGQQAAQEAAAREKTLDLAVRAQDFNERAKTAELGMQQQKLQFEDKKELRAVVDSLTAGAKDSLTAAQTWLRENPGADPSAIGFLVSTAEGFASRLDQIAGADIAAANLRKTIEQFKTSTGAIQKAKPSSMVVEGAAKGAASVAQAQQEVTGGLGALQGQTEGQKITAALPAKAAEAGAVAGAQAEAQLPFQIRLKQAEAAINAATAANAPKDKFKDANILRDEFNVLTKDFRTVNDAYNKIKSTSDTGAGDMSLLYSYVKLLDPGSVVRESEFATAAASGSYGERIQGLVQRIATGQRLPPSLRKDFLAEAANIYNGQKVQYDAIKDRYTSIAKKYGLDVADVIVDTTTPAQATGPLSDLSAEELMKVKKALGGKSN